MHAFRLTGPAGSGAGLSIFVLAKAVALSPLGESMKGQFFGDYILNMGVLTQMSMVMISCPVGQPAARSLAPVCSGLTQG